MLNIAIKYYLTLNLFSKRLLSNSIGWYTFLITVNLIQYMYKPSTKFQ